MKEQKPDLALVAKMLVSPDRYDVSAMIEQARLCQAADSAAAAKIRTVKRPPVLAVLDDSLSLLLREQYRATAERLGQARATVEAMADTLKLAQRRFSDQNGQVSFRVWYENYEAVKAINDVLAAFNGYPQ